MKIIAILLTGFVFVTQSLFGQTVTREDFFVAGLRLNQSPDANRSMLSCTPIYSFDTPDLNETGLSSDNINLWVGGGNGSGFYKCDGINGTVLQTLPMPPSPTGYYLGDLEVGGSYLWYVYEQDGLLLKIDPLTGTLVSQYMLPNNSPNPNDPNCWGIAYEDGFLWESEYAVNGPSSYNTMIYKLTYSAVPIDSFLIPHWILPIKVINGELWGVAFDVPYIYKINKTNGVFMDSIPRCVTTCYGLTQNNAGFWLEGYSTFNADKIHRFSTLTGVNELSQQEGKNLVLFPVPVNDILHIRNAFKGDEPVSVLVYSSLGELILDGGKFSSPGDISIDTGNLSPGIYQVMIISGNFKYSRKFVRM